MKDRNPPQLISTFPFGIPIIELLAIIAGLIAVFASTGEGSHREDLALTLAICSASGLVLCAPLSFLRLNNFVPDIIALVVGLAGLGYGFFIMGDTNIGGSAIALLAIGVTLSGASHLLRRFLANLRHATGG